MTNRKDGSYAEHADQQDSGEDEPIIIINMTTSSYRPRERQIQLTRRLVKGHSLNCAAVGAETADDVEW